VQISRSMTVAISETAMLGGILFAAFTIPRSTSLQTFLIVSVFAALIGNLLLFRALKRTPRGTQTGSNRAWPHAIRVLAILAAYWLLVLALDHI